MRPPAPSFSGEVAKRQRLEAEDARAERALQEVHARFQSAFDHAPIGMALVDTEGRWLAVNEALSRITGYSRDELKATTLSAMTHPDDVVLDAQPERRPSERPDPELPGRETLPPRLGPLHLGPRYVALVRDEEGQPRYVISQVQDISERKELAERLAYMVDHDFLTGLFNRRRFEQELDQEAQRVARYGFSGAVVLIDLDRFKNVNDALGHKAGDELLEDVARALRQRIRQTDVLARVGGDEFAVLLPQTDAEQAPIVAEGIVETLRQHVAAGGRERSINVTASVGVALFDRLTAAEVMALAMYAAKTAGRDRFAMYRPAPDRADRGSGRLGEAEAHPQGPGGGPRVAPLPVHPRSAKNEIPQYELLLRLPSARGYHAGQPQPLSDALPLG